MFEVTRCDWLFASFLEAANRSVFEDGDGESCVGDCFFFAGGVDEEEVSDFVDCDGEWFVAELECFVLARCVVVDASVVVECGEREVFECCECCESSESVDVSVVVDRYDVDDDAVHFFSAFDAEVFEVDAPAFSESAVDDSAWFDAFDAWAPTFEFGAAEAEEFDVDLDAALVRSVWVGLSCFYLDAGEDFCVACCDTGASFCCADDSLFDGDVSVVLEVSSVDADVFFKACFQVVFEVFVHWFAP